MCGTETGSPELLAAWRVLAAQGPMGQERRWVEVETRRREEPDGNTLPLLPRFHFLGTGLQLTTELTSSIGDGAACELPNRQRGQSLKHPRNARHRERRRAACSGRECARNAGAYG